MDRSTSASFHLVRSSQPGGCQRVGATKPRLIQRETEVHSAIEHSLLRHHHQHGVCVCPCVCVHASYTHSLPSTGCSPVSFHRRQHMFTVLGSFHSLQSSCCSHTSHYFSSLLVTQTNTHLISSFTSYNNKSCYSQTLIKCAIVCCVCKMVIDC